MTDNGPSSPQLGAVMSYDNLATLYSQLARKVVNEGDNRGIIPLNAHDSTVMLCITHLMRTDHEIMNRAQQLYNSKVKEFTTARQRFQNMRMEVKQCDKMTNRIVKERDITPEELKNKMVTDLAFSIMIDRFKQSGGETASIITEFIANREY